MSVAQTSIKMKPVEKKRLIRAFGKHYSREVIKALRRYPSMRNANGAEFGPGSIRMVVNGLRKNERLVEYINKIVAEKLSTSKRRK